MTLKRDLVKYIRDKAKSAYKKENKCYICNSSDDLDFHHYYGLTELLEKWLKDNEITISTADEIMEIRESFIEQFSDEIYNKTVTLCHKHHLKLHSIYGKRPKLITAEKQARWVDRQKEKHGMV